MGIFGPRRLGLTLESGGARGLAHIGVLKTFDEAGIAPDVITGTSMGAVIGAFYAAGYSAAEIEGIALSFDMRSLLGLADIAIGRSGMLSGDRVEGFLREYLPTTFEELRIPFGCVATDLARGGAMRFASGDLVQAIRASVSVPLVFLPLRLGDALYIDGFITDPLPVSFARSLGANVLVAVSVAGSGTVSVSDGQSREPGLLKALHSTLRGQYDHQAAVRGSSSLDIIAATAEIVERQLSERSRQLAHVVISPEVSDVSTFEYLATPRAVAAGEAAGRAVIADVRRKARL